MKKLNLFITFLMSNILFLQAQISGNALHFNALNGYVSADLPPLFNSIASNDFTIECWLKPEASNTSKRLFSAQHDANNMVSILVNGSSELYVFLRVNGIYYSTNILVNISLEEWTHIATTWDASSQSITCFINGEAIDGINGGTSSIGNNNRMTIGSRTDGSQLFKGSIDEVRIWDRIRSQCEIVSSMNTVFSASQPNLVASYSFNSGIAGGNNAGITQLTELNGNFGGTLNNFFLTGTTSNWVTSGAVTTTENKNDGIRHTIDTQISCEPFTWVDEVVYSVSNNEATYSYTDTIGCPAIDYLNLTVNSPTYSTDQVTACESFTWIDGITYTENTSSAVHTIANGAANGCDSIVMLNLNIKQNSTSTDVIQACNSYTWLDDITYTEDNQTATYTIANGSVNGCDSIVTLNLTINQNSTSTDIIQACNSYTWLDGITYTEDNQTATYTIENGSVNGCDSIVTLNLSIIDFSLSVSTEGLMMTANEESASYQWINCTDDMPIDGATDQSFTVTENGNYAVIITTPNCTDTSECIAINSVGLPENNTPNFVLYPNPNDGEFTIHFITIPESQTIHIFNTLGERVWGTTITNQMQKFKLSLPSGFYLLSTGTTVTSFSIQ